VAVTIVANFFMSSSFQFSGGFPGIMIAVGASEMKCPFGMISMHSAHDRVECGHVPLIRQGSVMRYGPEKKSFGLSGWCCNRELGAVE